MSDREIAARVGSGVAALDAAAWDACAGTDNPFLTHAFLSALEQSGSATARTGWQPAPITVDGSDGCLAAALPAYIKSHSQGEYVFDHAWADAYARAGGRYYPKLQIAVPVHTGAGPSPALPRSDACARAHRRSRTGGRRESPVGRPRHLHCRSRGAALRAGRLAHADRQPVPLAQ
jgi:predicted N-acyltransferase